MATVPAAGMPGSPVGQIPGTGTGPPLPYGGTDNPVNPATGRPFTPADLVNSGEFTANPGVYTQSVSPRGAQPPEAPKHPALPNPDQQYVDAFNASIGRQRAA